MSSIVVRRLTFRRKTCACQNAGRAKVALARQVAMYSSRVVLE